VKGVWLEDLTWPEAKQWFDKGAPVIVPIGAISKEHGPHLPLKTDWLLARDLARRVGEKLPVVLAPVISIGYYPAFVRYPGSQHLSAETFGALLTEIFAKLVRDGVKRLAVINTGVSTEPVLRVVVRDFYETHGVRVHTADIRTLGTQTRGLMKQKLGGHADEAETSMILAIEPKSVKLDRAKADYGNALNAQSSVFYTPAIFNGDPKSGADYSATGVRGDPTLASAEKGEAILADMAAELTEGLAAVFPDYFPAE
jgi:creatinine amidohydrolase